MLPGCAEESPRSPRSAVGAGASPPCPPSALRQAGEEPAGCFATFLACAVRPAGELLLPLGRRWRLLAALVRVPKTPLQAHWGCGTMALARSQWGKGRAGKGAVLAGGSAN